MTKRLFAVLIPALASAAFAAPASAATTSESVSANWAGYEATTPNGSGFSAASGSWVQPSVDCSAGQTYSAYWVGLGGGAQNSQALEQEGTQADCSASGQATYYAWYELVPSAPVKIDLAVHPGDRIWARTAVSGDQVTVEVDNKTTGQSFKKTLTMTSATPDTSTAEWVAEAPSECVGGASGNCQPLSLANFGKVTFTNAYARSNGQVKPVSGWNAQAIALSPSAGSEYGYGDGYGGGFGNPYASASATGNSAGAAPGSLSSDGSSFSVAYGASATSGTSTSTGYAYDPTTASGAGSGYAYDPTGGYGYGYGYGGGYGSSGYGYGDGSAGYGYGSGDGGYTIVVPTLF